MPGTRSQRGRDRRVLGTWKNQLFIETFRRVERRDGEGTDSGNKERICQLYDLREGKIELTLLRGKANSSWSLSGCAEGGERGASDSLLIGKGDVRYRISARK